MDGKLSRRQLIKSAIAATIPPVTIVETCETDHETTDLLAGIPPEKQLELLSQVVEIQTTQIGELKCRIGRLEELANWAMTELFGHPKMNETGEDRA